MGSGFNTLVKDDIKDYNGNYGQRLFDHKLGFIGSANFYQNNRGSQDLEPAYTQPGALQPRPSGLRADADALRRYRGRRLPPFSRALRSSSAGCAPNTKTPSCATGFRNIVSSGRLERLLRDRYHDSNQTAHSRPAACIRFPTPGCSPTAALIQRRSLDTPYRLEATFRQTGVTFAPNVTATFDRSQRTSRPIRRTRT